MRSEREAETGTGNLCMRSVSAQREVPYTLSPTKPDPQQEEASTNTKRQQERARVRKRERGYDGKTRTKWKRGHKGVSSYCVTIENTMIRRTAHSAQNTSREVANNRHTTTERKKERKKRNAR